MQNYMRKTFAEINWKLNGIGDDTMGLRGFAITERIFYLENLLPWDLVETGSKGRNEL